jgi:hypothetical protein
LAADGAEVVVCVLEASELAQVVVGQAWRGERG